jgi:hypothetical protein
LLQVEDTARLWLAHIDLERDELFRVRHPRGRQDGPDPNIKLDDGFRWHDERRLPLKQDSHAFTSDAD